MFCRAFITIGLFLLAWSVFASPAEEKEVNSIPVLDSTQDFFGNRLNALANRIDSFFATERADDELGRSSIRIRYSYIVRGRALPITETRYRFNLRLPRLEEKFRFTYDKDKKKKKKEEAEAVIPEDEAQATAKRNRVKSKWIFNADAGVSVAIPPRLVTRARLRRNIETGSFVHRFAEEVTYITDESGLIEETSLNSDLKISDSILFRFINSKRWQILKKDFLTSHGPTFLQQLTEDDAFSYNFIMSNVLISGSFYVTAYTLSINYRRNVYKNWVYLDIIPGLDFPKQWSFRRTPFAIAQIEVLFGG